MDEHTKTRLDELQREVIRSQQAVVTARQNIGAAQSELHRAELRQIRVQDAYEAVAWASRQERHLIDDAGRVLLALLETERTITLPRSFEGHEWACRFEAFGWAAAVHHTKASTTFAITKAGIEAARAAKGVES